MLQKHISPYVKTLVRKVIYFRQNIKLIRLLKNSAGQKRLIDFLTPNHGNLGDQAIVLCEMQFLKDYFREYQIIEVPTVCWDSAKKKIISLIAEEECILVHGGGFLGTLWMGCGGEPGFREILLTFPNNRIVVFPQSVYFGNDTFGKTQLAISQKIYQMHSRLSICVREINSYECIKKNNLMKDMRQCYLMPDIVTYFKKDFSGFARADKVLLCLRNDKEKVLSEDFKDQIVNALAEKGIPFLHTDMIVPYKMFAERRKAEVLRKMQEFASCRFVITDRLHGMLLAAVTATPCLFIDNCSKKVSGSYEWINNLEYIKPLSDIKDLQAVINQTAIRPTYHYNNDHLLRYYKKLAEIIKE